MFEGGEDGCVGVTERQTDREIQEVAVRGVGAKHTWGSEIGLNLLH